MKVGMIGLGVGTLATYGRQGDRYMFYEISPEDIAIATDTNMFTYLSDSAASIDIRQGDARIELGKDVSRGERFDVLVIDAYSGDAVPLHLMTAEAFRLYRRAVNDDGVIAVHLSNWHLNLWPLMKAAAAELGWSVCGLTSDAVLGEFAAATDWAFLTGKPLSAIAPLCCRKVDWSCVKNVKLPTDDMGSILPFIHFNYAPPVVDDVTQGD